MSKNKLPDTKEVKERKKLVQKYYIDLINKGIKDGDLITGVTQLGLTKVPSSVSPMIMDRVHNGCRISIIVIATPEIPMTAQEISVKLDIESMING